jgi:transcriptional regulator with XRE-family HTH domain
MTDTAASLGAFLRSKRDAASPPSSGSSRRAPGLRRSEVAQRAGVSVEYLTRIEQGRDRNPSGKVLVALAGALELDADERLELVALGKDAAGLTGLCGSDAESAPSGEWRW